MALVSTGWLAARRDDPGLVIADASWYMPDEHRNPKAEYLTAHIPGAIFFDIDAMSDRNTPLPHMLARAEDFAARAGALGLSDKQTIVFYDGAGLFSAPRAMWMLKTYGHDQVHVLDGGLPKWREDGHPIGTRPITLPANHFSVNFHPGQYRTLDQMREIVAQHLAQVVDARGALRFTGAGEDPRKGVRAGHMPGSKNMHYRRLLNPDGTLKPREDLMALYAEIGLDLNAPIVTTCGSGMTAAIELLALEQCGARDVALYDGSWTEWGGRSDTDVVRDGPQENAA